MSEKNRSALRNSGGYFSFPRGLLQRESDIQGWRETKKWGGALSFTLRASDWAANPLIRVRLSIQFGGRVGPAGTTTLARGEGGSGKEKRRMGHENRSAQVYFFSGGVCKFFGGVLRRKKNASVHQKTGFFLWTKGGAEKENGSVRNKKGGSRQNI